jgi:hypothetical protein
VAALDAGARRRWFAVAVAGVVRLPVLVLVLLLLL